MPTRKPTTSEYYSIYHSAFINYRTISVLWRLPDTESVLVRSYCYGALGHSVSLNKEDYFARSFRDWFEQPSCVCSVAATCVYL